MTEARSAAKTYEDQAHSKSPTVVTFERILAYVSLW